MPGYLLDTNTVSETRRLAPEPRVFHFLQSLRGGPVFVSVLTLGELRKGAEKRRLTDPYGAGALDHWIDTVEMEFAGRIIPIDLSIAVRWGEYSATAARPVVDTLIAATAAVRALTLVTRNVQYFRGLGVNLVNPWAS